LKVSSTQGGGLDHTEVCKDFWKLSMLLEESDSRGYLTPLAYVCILDNHATKRYNLDWLVNHRLVAEPYDKRIRMLHFSLHDVNQSEVRSTQPS
jgi:hypothetical protein